MKKKLTMMLTLMLLTSLIGGFCFADDNGTPFELILTKVPDYSLSEWYSSSMNRALLTVLLAADISATSNGGHAEVLGILKNPSFVVNSGLSLTVAGFYEDTTVLIHYAPIINYASFSTMPSPTSDVSLLKDGVESALKNTDSTIDCQENSQADIYYCMSKISEGLE